MDCTTIYMFISFIGILQKISLYHVASLNLWSNASNSFRANISRWNHFEAPEMVEWSKAEYICQANQGKLFKPNETSFDVSLFSKNNFKEDVWVSATSNIISSESASRLSGNDSVLRCETCKIGTNCGTSCSYKACGSRCRPLCEHEPSIRVLYDVQITWIEARQRCLETYNTLGDRIQNVSSLYFWGYCSDECFWTRNLIEVKFQTKTALTDAEGQCGILQNGTLSFTGCNRKLHPLCERVTMTTLETPRHYFSELMNTKITYMMTTEASQTTNRSNATITTSSTYGASSISNDIVKGTTFGLSEENSSLSVPVGVTTSRNDSEDSPHKSDTGIIIGSVIGSVVLLIITVLGIFCLRRKLLQRTGKRKSNHDGQNMKMHTTDTTHKPIYPYQRQDVSLEYGSGITPSVQFESKCGGSSNDIAVRQKSNPGKSASMIDPEEGNLNFATVNKNELVNCSNLNININYVSVDRLNDIRESSDDNVSGNVYDNRC